MKEAVGGHFGRLLDAEDSEDCRGDVGENTAAAEGAEAFLCVEENQRHGIGRVRGVRLAGFFVEHQLGVAVIRRDQRHAVHSFRGGENAIDGHVRVWTASTAASITPVCPTMSGLAMFMMMTSYFLSRWPRPLCR